MSRSEEVKGRETRVITRISPRHPNANRLSASSVARNSRKTTATVRGMQWRERERERVGGGLQGQIEKIALSGEESESSESERERKSRAEGEAKWSFCPLVLRGKLKRNV